MVPTIEGQKLICKREKNSKKQNKLKFVSRTFDHLLVGCDAWLGGQPAYVAYTVKRACADSPHPDVCFSTLSPYKDSKGADAHMLAGMAINSGISLLNAASATASFQKLHNEDMPREEIICFNKCADEFDKASHALTKSCETSDSLYDCGNAKLDDVRSLLVDAKKKHLQWNCQNYRQGEEEKKIVDEISPGNEVEKFMPVLEVLLDHAGRK